MACAIVTPASAAGHTDPWRRGPARDVLEIAETTTNAAPDRGIFQGFARATGAHAPYRWQPAPGVGSMLGNLEGTARVLDGTFLSLGYGFGDGDGEGPTDLTPGGLYLRMDVYRGTR